LQNFGLPGRYWQPFGEKIQSLAIPLNGLADDSPPRPVPPGADESAKLAEEARVNLARARELIERWGYHRRDVELAELEAVLPGHRCFADLRRV
jgi:hypothetical protein